jgi:hypothetical protein
MIEYSTVAELRKELKKMSKNVKFKVRLLESKQKGYVYINGIKQLFVSEQIDGEHFKMDYNSHGCLIRAFCCELAKQQKEAEDFALCKSMLDSEDHTKIHYENGKFIVETDNLIYKRAKTASELISMIANIKGGRLC